MTKELIVTSSLPELELSIGRKYFEDARLLAHAKRWESCLQLLAVASRHACRSLMAHHGATVAEYARLADRELPGRLIQCGVPNALVESVAALLSHARHIGYPDSPALDRDAAKTRFFTAQEIIDYVKGCL